MGRMVSSTSRSASRLPATASATTASRRSPEIVIGEALSSVTDGTGGVYVTGLNTNSPAGAARLSDLATCRHGAAPYQRTRREFQRLLRWSGSRCRFRRVG